MKTIILLTMLATVATHAYGGAATVQPLALHTSVHRFSGIAYTPVYMEIELVNQSDAPLIIPANPVSEHFIRFEVKGPADRTCAVGPAHADILKRNTVTLQAGERVRAIWPIAAEAGLLDAGQYRVRAVWSDAGDRAIYKAYRGRIEGDWHSVTIEAPATVDSDFVAAMKKVDAGHYRCRLADNQVDDQLVNQYPASTYSGISLVRGQPQDLYPFALNDTSRSIVDAVIRHIDRWPQYLVAYRPSGTATDEIPPVVRQLDVRRNLMETHLRGHANSSYSGWLSLRAGTLAFVKRDFPAACQLLKAGLEQEWSLPDADGRDRADKIAAAKYIIDNLRAEGLCP